MVLLSCSIGDVVINAGRVDDTRLILSIPAVEDLAVLQGWPHLSLDVRLGLFRLGDRAVRGEALRELLFSPVESGGLVALHGLLLLHGDRRRLQGRLSRGIVRVIQRLLHLLRLERIEDLVGAGHGSRAWPVLGTHLSIETPVQEVRSVIRACVGASHGADSRLARHLLRPWAGVGAVPEVLLGAVAGWAVRLQVPVGSFSPEHLLVVHLGGPRNELDVGLRLLKHLLTLELHRFRCWHGRRLGTRGTAASAPVSVGAQSWWVLLSQHGTGAARVIELVDGGNVLHARVRVVALDGCPRVARGQMLLHGVGLRPLVRVVSVEAVLVRVLRRREV